LIFAACHPVLSAGARAALTLRVIDEEPRGAERAARLLVTPTKEKTPPFPAGSSFSDWGTYFAR
jgi:hypothetical protein